MRQLFIPAIGQKLTLAEPWTFEVFSEYRNESILALMGKTCKDTNWQVIPVGHYTLTAGTELTVDRLYIRQGGEEYNSITFRANIPTKVQTGIGSKKEQKVRFWVKLEDANLIRFKEAQ